MHQKNISYMINFWIIIFLFFFSSCSQTPNIYKTEGSLKNKINSLINASNLSTNLGIKAISLRTGEVLLDLNSDALFNPASNNKIYTCLSALALLDTNYTFSTKIYTDEKYLYLVGGGDPDLSIDELDSLASVISTKISGNRILVLDDSIFDHKTYGEGWMWDEGSWWYAAQISGLSVNDNCVDFIIDPGKVGKPAEISSYPESNYYSIINNSVTVSDTINFQEFKIERDWEGKTNVFTISGNILDTTSTDTIYRNIHDPTKYTGYLFKKMLDNYGVNITQIQKGMKPNSSKMIAIHKSKDLRHTLKNLMVESDNLTAELLIKTIGYENNKSQGNWEDGLIRTREFLHNEVELDSTSFSIKDGSGVSRYNYSSPNHMIKILSWAYNNQSIKDIFLLSLPNGGENGTVKDRDLPSNTYIKSGSLAAVTTISGYIINDKSNPIIFSIFMNGFEGSSEQYKKLQDQIINTLAENK